MDIKRKIYVDEEFCGYFKLVKTRRSYWWQKVFKCNESIPDLKLFNRWCYIASIKEVEYQCNPKDAWFIPFSEKDLE